MSEDYPSRKDALAQLEAWGAPAHLVRHARLVSDVAAELLAAIQARGVRIDEALTLAGAALHDVGKILHPEELHAQGARHEEAGERWLRERGYPEALCRVCLSHARYDVMECRIEELVVALADKLWKGKRAMELEERVIARCAEQLGADLWELSEALDGCFEALAMSGDARLVESAGSSG